MILTIKGADFSLANIGTLDTFSIRKSIGKGTLHSIPNFVTKNSSVEWTITLEESYDFIDYSITMGNEVITPVISGKMMIISIPAVTAFISINISTKGIEYFTYTVNTLPKVASVLLTAGDYTQTGNSIKVPEGTTVTWTVENIGYTPQTGTEIISSDLVKDVELTSADETHAIVSVYGIPEGGTVLFTPSQTKQVEKDNNTIVLDSLEGRCYWGYTKDGYEPMGDVIVAKVPITNVETTLTELPIVTVIRELDLTTEATNINGYFVTTGGNFNGFYSNFRHLQIPVQPGQRYRVTTLTGQNASPALFCTTLPDISSVDFSSNPSGNSIPKYTLLPEYKKYAGPPTKGTYIVEVPETAQYMIVNSQTGAAANNALKVELIN
jgi:hypothetical protein